MVATYADIPNNTAAQWWRDPGLRKNVFHLAACCMCVFYLGYDQALLTGLQSLPTWNKYFHSPSGNKLGLITAALYVGPLASTFVADKINQRYGRKVVIYIGSVIIIAGALLTTFAKSTGQFVGGRVILGAGGGATKVVASALLQEIAHPRLRAIAGAFYYGTYYVGATLSGWLCVAGLYVDNDWGWRFPCLVQIFGPIVVMIAILTAPESPRFLVKKGKVEQARGILAKYHANGDLEDPLVEFELREIEASIGAEANESSWAEFVRTPGGRRRAICIITLCIGTAWNGNGLVSYYLTPVLKTVGVTQPIRTASLNAGLQAFNLIMAWWSAMNVERWGRRTLFFVSETGMLFSYAIVMGLSAGFAETKKSGVGLAVIPFLFIYFAFYDIAWTPLPYTYTTEICPFGLRTKGLALFTTVQQPFIAFNQFVNPIALKNIAWKYYAVYLAIQASYLVFIYFLYPETKGMSLEEVGVVFDSGHRHARQKAKDKMNARVAAFEQNALQEKMEHAQEHVEDVKADETRVEAADKSRMV